ncbi:MAG: insulinase family protein [Flavobacteriales bacterium]|nr:insulinase family protein [Flavobacteriales bacterium]
MRSLHLILASLICLSASAQKKYAYTSVPGDPLEARIYTLDNGLQVWLSRNADAPRVQTNIAVRAGSKNDPGDATGLAHYLEHMLFKGTSRIGTSDWAKESVLLKQISDAYEQRRQSRDEGERERLYRSIDSLSTLAAAFAVPNEYDKMMKKLGARGTNAYTSTERTVYINDVPSDELERWMAIESERMQECVLRLFHTELETVYEEFNRGQDNDARQAYAKKNELLYPLHPYGTQTTIGRGEHLKNPSMEKIHAFFDAWYVPNNMAVILAGDIDYDRTIAMVDKHFGGWKRGETPAFTFKVDTPRPRPETAEVYGPDAEWVQLAWRFDGYASADPIMITLIEGILSNGQAGLIDLGLVQSQQVLDASASSTVQADYSEFGLYGKAKDGQSLYEVRDLLLLQIERLRRGDFDDWLIDAVVTDLEQRQVRYWNESNSRRASAMTDAFILRKDWKDEVGLHARMRAITKRQVVDFARTRLIDNYVGVFKRTGERRDAHHVAKPKITPIDIKRDGMSAWRKEWEKMPSATLEPEFIDYTKAIEHRQLHGKIPLAVVKNPTNDLFSLRYILEMGTNHDPLLEVALEYLRYLGTSARSPSDFKKDLFRLGLAIDVFVGEDRCYVTLTGSERNLPKGIGILENLLADAQPNDEALRNLVADIRKARQDELKSKGSITSALVSHARYGERSPFNTIVPDEQLARLTSDELIQRIRGLCGYQHSVFYYGRMGADEAARLIEGAHAIGALKEIPKPRAFPELPTTKSKVLFAEHDMVQAEMFLVSKAGPFDAAKMPYASLFNEYFGSGLSSIVFQEIREAKALAYGASASYTSPAKKEEAHYVRAFIGTQADKLGDAVDAMLVLMNDMPMALEQFEGAKASALKVIASTRITKENIYWSWDAARRRGIDIDIRKLSYERIPSITIEDMKGFFDKEIKGRPFTYCVIGKEGAVDLKVLEKLGPVTRLDKQQLFGYPEARP